MNDTDSSDLPDKLSVARMLAKDRVTLFKAAMQVVHSRSAVRKVKTLKDVFRRRKVVKTL